MHSTEDLRLPECFGVSIAAFAGVAAIEAATSFENFAANFAAVADCHSLESNTAGYFVPDTVVQIAGRSTAWDTAGMDIASLDRSLANIQAASRA